MKRGSPGWGAGPTSSTEGTEHPARTPPTFAAAGADDKVDKLQEPCLAVLLVGLQPVVHHRLQAQDSWHQTAARWGHPSPLLETHVAPPVSLHPLREPAGAPRGAACDRRVTSTAILADLTASKRVFCSGLLTARLLPSPPGSLLRGRFETWREGIQQRFGAAPGRGTRLEEGGRTYRAVAQHPVGSPLAAQPQRVLEVAAGVPAAEVPAGTARRWGTARGRLGPHPPWPPHSRAVGGWQRRRGAAPHPS